MGPALRARGSIALIAALLGMGVLGSSLALAPRNDSKALGERFVLALDGGSDDRPEAYLSADAQVYLQGATSGLSRGHFQEYLERLKRSRQVFHAASPVYVTDSGAGWLVDIEHLAEVQIVNPPGRELPPQLWMEASIADHTITRLWIHFTVEALARQHIQPDVYRAAAELRGTPVPDAWQDGTVAMLAAAQWRGNQAAEARGIEALKPALIVAAWAPIVVVVGMAWLRRPRRRQMPTRVCQGQLLAHLREIHSQARAVGPGGSGESPRLAQRSGCATGTADLEHNRTSGFGAYAPAGMDDYGPRSTARADAETDELVPQA